MFSRLALQPVLASVLRGVKPAQTCKSPFISIRTHTFTRTCIPIARGSWQKTRGPLCSFRVAWGHVWMGACNWDVRHLNTTFRHFCFVIGKSEVQISNHRPVIRSCCIIINRRVKHARIVQQNSLHSRQNLTYVKYVGVLMSVTPLSHERHRQLCDDDDDV
jgi:hypothetical protein